ncbi:unnamed protein product, partial [Didymodactylos carnosus]
MQSYVEDAARSGRPRTAINEETIDAVRSIIEDDPHSAYEQIEHTLGIGSSAVNSIIHEYLKLHKMFTRWVPHQLTNDQKQFCIQLCRDSLERFEGGQSCRVFDIITGDESWFYHYDPTTKEQSKVWVSQTDPRSTKVHRYKSSGKRMVAIFFMKSGLIKSIPLERVETVTKRCKTDDIVIANSDTNQPAKVDGDSTPVRQPLSDRPSHEEHVTLSKKLSLFLMLTLRSLGVVFGDIGTSPLYVVNTIFVIAPSESQCIGAISLIIWNLIVVVSVKYAIFILMADNQGEGGTFALCGLLTGERSRLGQKAKKVVIVVSIVAASLIIGDGCLTPAVSVLSAIEGLALNAPRLAKYTAPITIVIVFLLFMAQRWGTAKIGIAFGPVMIVWFLVIF